MQKTNVALKTGLIINNFSLQAIPRILDADAEKRNSAQKSQGGSNTCTDAGLLLAVEAGIVQARVGQAPLLPQVYPWERRYGSAQEFQVFQ
jgi:hypothetical protein